jgi:hypothetical protein
MAVQHNNPIGLLNWVTVTGASDYFEDLSKQLDTSKKAVQVSIAGIGAIKATVAIEVTNTLVGGWLTYATFIMSGDTLATEGFSLDTPWCYIRANITSIDTGTSVLCTIGV